MAEQCASVVGMTAHTETGAQGIDAYYAGLGEHEVAPLWKALRGLLPKEPKSRAVPHVWRYETMRGLLMRAGELVSAEEAERRVLMLVNPGLDGAAAATTNVYAGLQLVLPGEIAPAHRHGAGAVRFIIEGEGAHTTVDGERTIMAPGDLVLTPNSSWHDHGNQSDSPVIWLDALDLPMVNAIEGNYFELDEEQQEQELAKPVDASRRLYAHGRLNPVWQQPTGQFPSPLINYPWSRTEQVLREAVDVDAGSPYDGVVFEYANPLTGGSVLPTLGCFVQQLAAGLRTDAHRHTSSAVYQVVSGSGRTIVDGTTLEWTTNDTFVVPGWAVHEHVNDGDEPATLFSVTDDPVIRALGLYREEAVERQS